jgi:hypothetical protein
MWWTRERRRAVDVAGRVEPRERWAGAQDERRLSVRQNRVVLTPRRWRQVCGFNLQMTVTNKPDHRGERGISRRAITQGMPGASAEPVCSCAHPLSPLRTRPRVQRAPGIPCALRFSRVNPVKTRARRAAGARSHVLDEAHRVDADPPGRKTMMFQPRLIALGRVDGDPKPAGRQVRADVDALHPGIGKNRLKMIRNRAVLNGRGKAALTTGVLGFRPFNEVEPQTWRPIPSRSATAS